MKPYKTGQGNWQLNYTLDGRQRTLSLGRGITAVTAERTAKVVTELVVVRKMGEVPPTDLLHRVGTLPGRVRSSLERGGLIESCFGMSVGEVSEKFLQSKKHLKPKTFSIYSNIRRVLIRHFGQDRSIATISVLDGKAFIGEYSQTMSKTSISSFFRHCRAFFRFAVDQGYIRVNPLGFKVERIDTDESRWHYVTSETILKILDACRNDHERLAVVLGRFGGLRVPSELEVLRFRDFEDTIFRVADNTKTGFREVPLFPEVQAIFNRLTGESDDLVFAGRSSGWYRCFFNRAIRRSGVTKWEKLWINLRSSFVTDLARMGYDEKTMDAIVGNSAAIRRKHYIQFDKRRAYERVLADAERIFSEDSKQSAVIQDLLPLLREFIESR